jgi:hypothetical protein
VAEDAPSNLERRVVEAAEAALNRQKFVSAVDVLTGIRWLMPSVVDDWRRGRVEYLADVAQVRPERLDEALVCLVGWARSKGLEPAEVAYLSARRDRRALRFTADGDSLVERLYRTHWTSPELSEAQRQRLTDEQNKAPDLVVIIPLKHDWTCAGCGDTDELLVMDDAGPLCLTCVDLSHLVFLAAGDAALSRRARKASGLSAVVVKFSRSRKRYERQGILVEEAALEQAEQQCLKDEDARQRRRERDRQRRAAADVAFQSRMAGEIVRLFPGCPAPRAEAIAQHAGLRGSGRVGRSAAGRALDAEAITLAVVASVRHADTDYDRLLMAGTPRAEARDRVRPAVDRVLETWRTGP